MGVLGAIGRGIAKGAKAVGKGIVKAAQKIKEKITGKPPTGGTPAPPEPPGDGIDDDWAEAVIEGFLQMVEETYVIYVDERPTQKTRAKKYYNKVINETDKSKNQDKYAFAESLESQAGEIIRYFEQALYDSKDGSYYLNICLSMIREAATGKPTTVADSIEDTESFYGEDI